MKAKFKKGDVLYCETYNLIAVYQCSLDSLGFDILKSIGTLNFPQEYTHIYFTKIGEL